MATCPAAAAVVHDDGASRVHCGWLSALSPVSAAVVSPAAATDGDKKRVTALLLSSSSPPALPAATAAGPVHRCQ